MWYVPRLTPMCTDSNYIRLYHKHRIISMIVVSSNSASRYNLYILKALSPIKFENVEAAVRKLSIKPRLFPAVKFTTQLASINKERRKKPNFCVLIKWLLKKFFYFSNFIFGICMHREFLLKASQRCVYIWATHCKCYIYFVHKVTHWFFCIDSNLLNVYKRCAVCFSRK